MWIDRLRDAVRSSGLSQDEVADRCGVTQATLSRWINGKRPVYTHNLTKLCRVLGISPAVLFDPATPIPKPALPPAVSSDLEMAEGVLLKGDDYADALSKNIKMFHRASCEPPAQSEPLTESSGPCSACGEAVKYSSTQVIENQPIVCPACGVEKVLDRQELIQMLTVYTEQLQPSDILSNRRRDAAVESD